MEKPKFLYHASPARDIKEFQPRKITSRDHGEPPAVFATPKEELATIFMTPVDDSWVTSGSFNGKKTWFVVISDKERYSKEDNGGAVYRLPSNTFGYDSSKGLGTAEWASYVSIKPVGKEEYSSTLKAMLDHGVQVYFTDKKTYRKIRKAKDHGFSILEKLTSVNQERVINPKPLI